MLLFAYAGRGSLVPISGRRTSLKAFAVRGAGDERRIVLVNKDIAKDAHVRIATTGQKAAILRLTAPSAESKDGVTFGGASVNPNGDWTPRLTESVKRESNRFVVELPAASAAIVEIHTG
jgi:hypothetical protein